MASLPPEPTLPPAIAGRAAAGAPDGLAQAWAQVHRETCKLTALAGLAPEPETAQPAITALAEAAPAWQRNLAAQGLDDIAAMLASGLAALATLSARGQDAAAPALALWREVHAARAAVLAVLHHEEVV